MKKEMNNKGFSLVELIIVIAIMAVLMGVLAPQFIKYVENSRVQKDDSAVGEVQNAAKIAMAVESVYKNTSSSASITVADGSITNASGTTASLEAEIAKTITASEISFTSKKRTGHTYTIELNYDGARETYTVNGSWN